MPELKCYDLFISHAWKYNDSYYRLTAMLLLEPNFKFRNYSVPEHDPVFTIDEKVKNNILYESLKKQIRPVNCVLVISGMYVSNKYWIQKEIDFAVAIGKPIIGIKPWGQERIPTEVTSVAKEMVAWQTSSIVSAIRKHSL